MAPNCAKVCCNLVPVCAKKDLSFFSVCPKPVMAYDRVSSETGETSGVVLTSSCSKWRKLVGQLQARNTFTSQDAMRLLLVPINGGMPNGKLCGNDFNIITGDTPRDGIGAHTCSSFLVSVSVHLVHVSVHLVHAAIAWSIAAVS